jgi:hypothetical protein
MWKEQVYEIETKAQVVQEHLAGKFSRVNTQARIGREVFIEGLANY